MDVSKSLCIIIIILQIICLFGLKNPIVLSAAIKVSSYEQLQTMLDLIQYYNILLATNVLIVNKDVD